MSYHPLSVEERNALFGRYIEPRIATVRRHVARLALSPADVDDCLQEVLVHILLHIASYDPHYTIDGWLARVVTFKMIDLRRETFHDVLRYVLRPAAQHQDASDLTTDTVSDLTTDTPEGFAPDAPDPALDAPLYFRSDGHTVEVPMPVVTPETYPALHDALTALPLPCRNALILQAEGWSTGEIAQMIQTTPDAVRKMLSRAKQHIRSAARRKASA